MGEYTCGGNWPFKCYVKFKFVTDPRLVCCVFLARVMVTGAGGRIAFQLHPIIHLTKFDRREDVAMCPANDACCICIQEEIVTSELGAVTSNRRQFRDGKQFRCRLIGVPNLAREWFDHPSAFHAHGLQRPHTIGAKSPFLFGP